MKRTGFKARGKSMHSKAPMRKVSKKRAARRKSSLRENARGQECTMRLPGCRGGTEHTVLCHVRRNGWGGMSLKPNDLLAFFACDVCHEKEERMHRDCTDADILRALGETLLIQEANGILKV